jgi:hypothetical protein
VTNLLARVGGLCVALVAAAALIVLGGRDRPPAAPTGPLTLAAAWPGATVADLPASLADGPAYSPVYFLDARTSFGTAPSPDGGSLRLLRRAPDGAIRELRRLPMDGSPQYGGFVSDGAVLAWSESVADDRGRSRSQMWVADLEGQRPARRLTADTGEVVFFNSEHDMVIAEGRLHWAAVAPGDDAATQLRSVPLAGGEVDTSTEPGQWAMSRWPYLVSAGSGQSGPVALRDPRQGRTAEVDAAANELMTCSPAWCRVQLLSSDGPTRLDLMRPDGADRRRIAGGTATAALIDVAVLDRFEVLTQAGPEGPLASNQELFLYDLTDRRTVLVAGSVGLVSYRAGVLWWSTGVDETTVWHALDLRTLAARD